MSLLENLGFSPEECALARKSADSLVKRASYDETAHRTLRQFKKKIAFDVASAAQNVGESVGASALAALGFGAANALVDQTGKAINAMGEKKRKQQAYVNMMAINEELQQADPERVGLAFDTLYTFNPDYAKNPLVASEFVQQVIDSARLPINTVNDLVRARDSIARANSSAPYLRPDMAPIAIGRPPKKEHPGEKQTKNWVNQEAKAASNKGKKKKASTIRNFAKGVRDAATLKDIRRGLELKRTAKDPSSILKKNKKLNQNPFSELDALFSPKNERPGILNREGNESLRKGIARSGALYGTAGAVGAGVALHRHRKSNKKEV